MKIFAKIVAISVLSLSAVIAHGQEIAKPTALGSPNAKQGGTLTIRLEQYPRTLNYFTNSDQYGGLLAFHTRDTLTWSDYETWEQIPYVASSWTMSPDKLKLTFKLNPDAKFSDGSPLTADDIVFTFDTIFDPKNNTADNKAYLDAVKSWKKTDAHTVEFEFKRVHFSNLDRVGGVYLLQKSFYGQAGKDFNKDFNNTIKGSGPYVYDEKASQRNRKIVLTRNKSWWGQSLPWAKGVFNFDKIVYNVMKDTRVGFEDFKKGNLGYFNFSADGLELWAKETDGPEFKGGKFSKLTYPYANPILWGGVAINMRREPTSEIKFREALQHLFNRQLYVDKLFYGLQIPIRGPFTNFTPYASPNLKVPAFDPAKAAANLKALGYTKADSDGVLYKEKDGKKIRAEVGVLYAYEPHEKYLTIFKEDAKKVGIQVNLQFMEWAAATKLLDEWKFDMFVISWMGNPAPEPEQLWMSKFANEKSSSNYPGFASPEADKLMDQAGAEFDMKKRLALYHKIEETIVGQHPYLWRWQQKEHYYAINKDKVATPEKIWKFTGDALRYPPHIYWWDPKAK